MSGAVAETLFVRRRDAFVSAALAAFVDCASPPATLHAAE